MGRRKRQNYAVSRTLSLSDEASDFKIIEAAAAGADGKAGPRRFSMVAYTGGELRLNGWSHPVVVDLAGIAIDATKHPILRDHDLNRAVGHSDSIRVEGSKIKLDGVFSATGATADEIQAWGLNGFPWRASIGATVEGRDTDFIARGQPVTVNGRDFEGPLYVARRARLNEVSFVVRGADRDTSAQIAARERAARKDTMDKEFEKWLQAKGFAKDNLSDAQTSSLRAMYDAELEAAGDGDGDGDIKAGEGKDPPAGSAKDIVATIRKESAAEFGRIAAIRKLCAENIRRAPAAKVAEIEAKAVEEGWDPDRAKLELLEASLATVPNGGVRRDGDTALAPRAIEAALCMSAGLSEEKVGKIYGEKVMNAAVAGGMRGSSLHALMRHVIRAAGGSPGDTINDSFIDDVSRAERTLRAQESEIRAAGGSGISTISLSGILSNVAGKVMLDQYGSVESVVSMFCNEVDKNDFKTTTAYRLTGSGIFEEVGPDGELKHATLAEASFTNRVKTFGRMFGLTRQMIIDDDLGAFLQIPRIIGRMSAIAKEKAVFTLLLSNPSSFFGTGNRNYISGADTALSIGGLTLLETKLAEQVDSEGNPILANGSVLLVPSALKVIAQQLMTEARINETTTADKGKPASNPHVGKWKIAASPFLSAQGLSGSSAVAYYIFANPADLPTMEIGYLRGKRVPTIESSDASFNILGMQWRGYFDFGVAMQDPRGAAMSKGAA